MHYGRKLTVGNYARQFQNQRRALADLSPLTIERDEVETRKIEELFGKVSIDQLSAGILNETYAKLRANDKVSRSQLYKIHAKLRQVLKQAVLEEIIERNPCDRIRLSRPKPKERRSLSIEDATKLADTLRKEEQSGKVVALWLGLATGIRRGEALGLIWRHVDLDNKRIYIAQQLACDMTFREPKSESSHRWIGIDNETVDFLTRWKNKQHEELGALGLNQTSETPLATNELGGASSPSNFSRWRRDFFVAIGLGYFEHEKGYTDSNGSRHVSHSGYHGYSFHELRHTQATLLIGSGADIKTVQHRLGHSSATLTMNIYAHAIAANDRDAANTIGGMIFERNNR